MTGNLPPPNVPPHKKGLMIRAIKLLFLTGVRQGEVGWVAIKNRIGIYIHLLPTYITTTSNIGHALHGPINILKLLLPPSWHQKMDRWMASKEARRKGPTCTSKPSSSHTEREDWWLEPLKAFSEDVNGGSNTSSIGVWTESEHDWIVKAKVQ